MFALSLRRRRGFKLLEIAVVVVVVAILAVFAIPVYTKLRGRAERVKCTSNLRSLYVAANAYVQENETWPQIRLAGADDASGREYATEWIQALAPSGPTPKTWICPTIQKLIQSPDYLKPENVRTDYFAMTFDDKPSTPHQWPKQPWFIERADVHGNGNLMVLTDGSIIDLKTAAAKSGK